ncbi:hypothetical protein LTR37_010818 [Vermiconidia calcicola]|uniref:Uncharacterized protein n=1 Tax=Vermiconidia calcicola TaxID=1690605 RepID=A0ACC3N430_9PEZI|nr:hypothetical protein LTR37_010818 [Vermiconidia calcicola]
MKAAFEILGIPTAHWVTMGENPPDMSMWLEAFAAKFDLDSSIQPFGRAEFDQLLGHWGGTTDQPAAFFAEELVQAYPEAKVVLVERDVDRWYKSYSECVIDGTANPLIPLASKIDRRIIGRMGELTDLIVKYCFNVHEPRARGIINNPEFFSQWRANAKRTYLEHIEIVKKVTPEDRLLIFKLEDGWEPLCRFLGKPVPEVPFPRFNETEAVQEKINLYITQSYKRSILKFAKQAMPAVIALVAAALWWSYQR